MEALATASPAIDDYLAVPGLLITVTANIVSIVGVVWLLQRCSKLPPQSKKRLFPKQIRALAASDLVFHLASTALCVDSFGGLSWKPSLGLPVCRVCEHFVRFGTNMSLLLELHIAMSFTLQCFRWLRALSVFPALVYLTIPVALLITVLEAILYQVTQDTFGACVLDEPDLPSIALFLLAFAVSMMAYVVAACKARGCSQAVEARCWKRAAHYPLSFLVTQVGMIVVIFKASPNISPKQDLSVLIAMTLQNLNGFANTLTYALQSRYAAKLQRDTLARCGDAACGGANVMSFEARFGGVMVEEILPASVQDSSKACSDEYGGGRPEPRVDVPVAYPRFSGATHPRGIQPVRLFACALMRTLRFFLLPPLRHFLVCVVSA